MAKDGCCQRWLFFRGTQKATLGLLVLLVAPAVVGRTAFAAPPTAAPAAASTLTLQECLQLASSKQPNLAAHRASLAAAADSQRAIECLHIPTCLVRDLPARRQQAAVGVNAAASGLAQAEQDMIYAVTRCYFTVIYAREQEDVARGIVERIGATYDIGKRMLDAGARDVTTADIDRTSVYLGLAETRRIQATIGVARALAALKEAIGLDCDETIDVPRGKLPHPQTRPDRNLIVSCALSNRGDLAQTLAIVEAANLEICAQRTGLCFKKQTFALAGDIHAWQVPQEARTGDYRPGAIPPEMPGILVGSSAERMCHARSLSARAAAASDKTRNLIVLEAEDAFLRWDESTQKVAAARKATITGDKLADQVSKDFTAGLRIKVEDVLNVQVLAAQTRSQYNEFLHQQILALAELERITGGSWCAGLSGAPLAANQSTGAKNRPNTTVQTPANLPQPIVTESLKQ